MFLWWFQRLFEFTFHALRRFRNSESDDGWNAAIAGFVGGLSILFQPADSRRTLGLYMFARVLQCAYNALKDRGKVRPLPYGDAWLFAISSAMVMYCYVLRPQALSPSFYRFILRTGPIASIVLDAVRATTYKLPFNVEPLKEFVRKNWNISPSYAFFLPSPTVDGQKRTMTIVAWMWKMLTAKRKKFQEHGVVPSSPESIRTVMSSLGASATEVGQVVFACSDSAVSLVNIALGETLTGNMSRSIDLTLEGTDGELPKALLKQAIDFAKKSAEEQLTLTKDRQNPLLETLLDTYLGRSAAHVIANSGPDPIYTVACAMTENTIKDAAAPFTPTPRLDAISEAVSSLQRMASHAVYASTHTQPLAQGAYHLDKDTMKHLVAFATLEKAQREIQHGSGSKIIANAVGESLHAWPPGSCARDFARVPCFALHPQTPHSCLANGLRVFTETVIKMLPLYSSLTFVPLVVFRTVRLISQPIKHLLEALRSLAGSLVFIGAFSSVYQMVICFQRNLSSHSRAEMKFNIFFAGIVCGFVSVLFERKSRRSDLALYLLPRAVDSFVWLMREKGYLPGPMLGSYNIENLLLWCTSMSALGYYFVHEPQHMSSLVYTIMSYLLGRDPLADVKKQEKLLEAAVTAAEMTAAGDPSTTPLPVACNHENSDNKDE